MPEVDSRNDPTESLVGRMQSLERGLRRVKVALIVLALLVGLLAAATFGSLVNYFGRDATLYGGSTVGAALAGFFCGWFARRR